MSWTVVEKKLCASADPMVTIVMDSTSDASDLPTAGFSAGSVAVVAGSDMPAYMLSASGTWENINDGGGGGGGGGGDCNLFPVKITVNYDNPEPDGRYPFTVDKTFAEMAEAIDAGKMLLIREGNDEYGYNMNVPTNVYHQLGSDVITFSYVNFCTYVPSEWAADMYEYTITEDGGRHLSQTPVLISVTTEGD